MRKVFLEVKYVYQAQKAAPWASIFAKVDGGFFAFESIQDYATYKEQQ